MGKSRRIVLALLLIVLCCVSCAYDTHVEGTGGSGSSSEVNARVPAWLGNRTWSGNVTVSNDGYSQTQYMTFTFGNDTVSSGSLPSGYKLDIHGSGNSLTMTISGSTTQSYPGAGSITANVSGQYSFTRQSSNKCRLSGSITSNAGSVTIRTTISGVLTAN